MEKYDRRRSRSPARQIFEASSPAVSQQMAAIAPKSFKYGFLIYLQNPLKRPQNIWLDCNGMLQEFGRVRFPINPRTAENSKMRRSSWKNISTVERRNLVKMRKAWEGLFDDIYSLSSSLLMTG